MVAKPYDWASGPVLEDHTRRKHKILREYFARYIAVRCQLPQQEKFRLAIVDGFAGAGRYSCGSPGSPLIFLEVLRDSISIINANRAQQGLKLLQIECLLVFNDAETLAIELLKANCAEVQSEISQSQPYLHIEVMFSNEEFEAAYASIKSIVTRGRYQNIIFNLDQCGHSKIAVETIEDIMRLNTSVEIFYTFAVQSLVSFLKKSDPSALLKQLQPFGVKQSDLAETGALISKSEWLGAMERVVFSSFRKCAPFVSPFSINNPDGWKYWLVHFARSYRARQVYNNILHDNSSCQAHFGRSGLNMLAYDPSHDGALYLFDVSGREAARVQLQNDIPKLVLEAGDAVGIGDFYEAIYNSTPAHMDDIHSAIIENPDLEVITDSGGTRRKAGTISVTDTIKVKDQKSFFPMFVRPHKS